MSFLVPAALAFGIIIPIILLLYFMRPKRQDRVVGSTLLWQQALQDLQASRPWQRLRITPLLLLQLLAALVIVLILARPAIFLRSPISGNTIIILQAFTRHRYWSRYHRTGDRSWPHCSEQRLLTRMLTLNRRFRWPFRWQRDAQIYRCW
ncbi:MAG: hypothetical protein E6J21_06355 [Chloroflexota bacterium]|nr:MAG: hypothetical protein E6J21_06355 [Chloroflexota bacterium]